MPFTKGHLPYKPLGVMKLGLEAVCRPSLLDIAWAAGIYEGEGSVQRNTGAVGICQKDKEILLRLTKLFGGSISSCGNRPLFQWHISGARARGFLLTIFSFLSLRRKQAIKFLFILS